MENNFSSQTFSLYGLLQGSEIDIFLSLFFLPLKHNYFNKAKKISYFYYRKCDKFHDYSHYEQVFYIFQNNFLFMGVRLIRFSV